MLTTMSTARAILLAVVYLITGALAGGWGVSYFYWQRFTNDLCVGSLSAEASTTTGILKRLRADDRTNAVELLEVKLNGALVGLGAFLSEIPKSRRDPTNIKAIQMAKDYRAQFPRTNDSPQIQNAIADAFGLLESRHRAP